MPKIPPENPERLRKLAVELRMRRGLARGGYKPPSNLSATRLGWLRDPDGHAVPIFLIDEKDASSEYGRPSRP